MYIINILIITHNQLLPQIAAGTSIEHQNNIHILYTYTQQL